MRELRAPSLIYDTLPPLRSRGRDLRVPDCGDDARAHLTKVALDRTWRAAWPTADAAARELIRNQVATYDALWNAMYFLVLIGFMVESIGLALATRREPGRPLGEHRVLGRCGAHAALLFPEVGAPTLPNSWTAWLYPATGPLGRFIIGLWLWREAARLPEGSWSPARSTS